MNRVKIRRADTKLDQRMPLGAVYVGRPTRFGNPFRMRCQASRSDRFAITDDSRSGSMVGSGPNREAAHQAADDLYRRLARLEQSEPETYRAMLAELRGRDLACWCRRGEPCHVDVLLSWLATQA